MWERRPHQPTHHTVQQAFERVDPRLAVGKRQREFSHEEDWSGEDTPLAKMLNVGRDQEFTSEGTTIVVQTTATLTSHRAQHLVASK